MNKIEQWLKENGFEYSVNKYGNPYYFNDGFYVEGISVSFYFDSIGNPFEKRHELEKFMKRKRAYTCYSSRFGFGVTYLIMTVFDYARLEKHEKEVQDAVEAFWQAEHARRILAAM